MNIDMDIEKIFNALPDDVKASLVKMLEKKIAPKVSKYAPKKIMQKHIYICKLCQHRHEVIHEVTVKNNQKITDVELYTETCDKCYDRIVAEFKTNKDSLEGCVKYFLAFIRGEVYERIR